MTTPARFITQLPPGGQVVETQFGDFVAHPGDIVNMAEGVPGFEACRRFFLLASPALEPLTCLQGIDEPRPAFLAVDPRLVMEDYHRDLDDLQKRRLQAQDGGPLLWLAIVCIREDGTSTANLRAPLVINPRRMLGLQLLAGGDRYSTEFPLG